VPGLCFPNVIHCASTVHPESWLQVGPREIEIQDTFRRCITEAADLLLIMLGDTLDAQLVDVIEVVRRELEDMLKEGGGLDTLVKRYFDISPEDDIRAMPSLTAALTTGASNMRGGAGSRCVQHSHGQSTIYSASDAAPATRFHTALGPLESLPEPLKVTKELGTDAPITFVINTAAELGLLCSAVVNNNRPTGSGGT